MELEQAITLFKTGQFVAIGEYRMSKAEIIKWRDKTNGKEMEAPILRHVVEFGDKSVAVNERVASNTKLDDIKVPFVKGDAVIMHVEELTAQKGLVSCRGRLEAIAKTSPGKPGASGAGGIQR
jgi:hypothetical protein